MSVFLTKIHINKVFHLENISIDIDEQAKKHLILTGKNGSGKTSLLNALVEVLQNIKNGGAFLNNLQAYYLTKRKLDGWWLNDSSQDQATKDLAYLIESLKAGFNQVEIEFENFDELSNKLNHKDFLFSYYSATRKVDVVVTRNPDKPNLAPAENIKDSKISEFIKFLVDLKVQEALARNENQIVAADEIKAWFEGFIGLLKQLFEDERITLDFNFRDYSFTINQGDRKFGFHELSDGYSALIDIIADLIIKMQEENSLTRAYEKEGIVLIDEVETHLHLKLQRLVLPMLTQIFPNIQFIVTTHSPFVLSSLNNAVAFDLEKCTRLDNLTEYSYEALAEGYFKVETESNFLLNRLERFKELAEIPEKDSAELAEYQNLDKEFAALDQTFTSPGIKGQYLQAKLSAK